MLPLTSNSNRTSRGMFSLAKLRTGNTRPSCRTTKSSARRPVTARLSRSSTCASTRTSATSLRNTTLVSSWAEANRAPRRQAMQSSRINTIIIERIRLLRGYDRLNVQIPDIQRVIFNEFAPGFHVLAHQCREDRLRLGQIFEIDLQQRALIGIHRRLPQLIEVHLAEPLEPLHVDFTRALILDILEQLAPGRLCFRPGLSPNSKWRLVILRHLLRHRAHAPVLGLVGQLDPDRALRIGRVVIQNRPRGMLFILFHARGDLLREQSV